MSTVPCKAFTIETTLENSCTLLKELILFGNFEVKKSKKPIKFVNAEAEKEFILNSFNEISEIIQFFLSKCDLETRRELEGISISKELLQSINTNQESALKIYNDIKIQYNRYNELNTKGQQLTEILEALSPYKNVELELFREFNFINTIFFRIDIKLSQNLIKLLKERYHTKISFKLASTNKKYQYYFLVTDCKLYNKVKKYLNKNQQVEVLQLEGFDSRTSPHKSYLGVISEIKACIDEKNRVKLELIKNLRKNYSSILALQTLCALELEVLNNLDSICIYNTKLNTKTNLIDKDLNTLSNSNLQTNLSLNSIVHIDGWMDEQFKSELEVRLSRLTATNLTEPKKGFIEKFGERIVLKNNPLLRPFEVITRVMGIPRASELDPSPMMSLFFVFYFGFAIGDAAYGLVFLAIGIYLLTKQKISSQIKDYALLIIYSGISTFLFGAITGSWFGLNLAESTNPIASFLLSFKLFDFDEAVIPILVGSILIGLVQQALGMLLSLYNSYKSGKFVDGLSSTGTWFYLLASIIFFASTSLIEPLKKLNLISQISLFFSLVLFVIGQSRSTKNVFLKPFVGLANLFNITGYFSNTLSYARLLPLGLATAVIASVVNLLANTFGSTESGFGLIVFILIFVIGHIFNIVISTMGGAINVLRLQLVEFLPLFYKGDGQELDPLKLNLLNNALSIAHQMKGDLNADLFNRSILK